MQELNKETWKTIKKEEIPYADDLPERVLQFGEGNFLRGFADWMFHKLNANGLFNGKVIVVQPIESGLVDILNRQDCLYTLFIRGIDKGVLRNEREIIRSIRRGIDPYRDYAAFIQCAENPDLRIIISNTTEAGIAYVKGDRLDDRPQKSFPGKLTAFLYKRFFHFKGDTARGFLIIPCELIDKNADHLKEIIKQYSKEWNLGEAFETWLDSANVFANSLVDGIVTGYPREEADALTEELGYKDNLMDVCEPFHLWGIEADEKFGKELPLKEIGLDVFWTDNLAPYKLRKVRVLNGTHTMTVLAAYLYGKNTVKDCIDDEIILKYMKKGVIKEILPTLDLPEQELKDYSDVVFERFSNPFIKHYLLSISLNSISKFKTRVLPSILQYMERFGKPPEVLAFSLAALLAFYKGGEIKDGALIGKRDGKEYKIMDDREHLEMMRDLWAACDGNAQGIHALVCSVLSRETLWGEDLTKRKEFARQVENHLDRITNEGIRAAIEKVL